MAGAGQARISIVDARVGIADTEVGHVVVAGQPRRHGVGDLVGLGLEGLSLNETAEWFGVSEEEFISTERRSVSGTKFSLVVTAREVGHLTGTLEVDVLSLVDGGEDGVVDASGSKSVDTGVFLEDGDFLTESTGEGVFIFWLPGVLIEGLELTYSSCK